MLGDEVQIVREERGEEERGAYREVCLQRRRVPHAWQASPCVAIVPAPAPTTAGGPRPCWSLRQPAPPPHPLVASAATPAGDKASGEAVGEVTCGEAVGEVTCGEAVPSPDPTTAGRPCPQPAATWSEDLEIFG